tara:strand:- start:5094 stop:5561 length:468 start_codon:yes stop_codon:yes gene_type:complete
MPGYHLEKFEYDVNYEVGTNNDDIAEFSDVESVSTFDPEEYEVPSPTCITPIKKTPKSQECDCPLPKPVNLKSHNEEKSLFKLTPLVNPNTRQVPASYFHCRFSDAPIMKPCDPDDYDEMTGVPIDREAIEKQYANIPPPRKYVVKSKSGFIMGC